MVMDIGEGEVLNSLTLYYLQPRKENL